MARNSEIATVRELVRRGVLHVEDGNHGEQRPLAHEFSEIGTPFVRPDDLVHGRVAFETCDHINDEALQRIRKGKGRAGDIVFTHRATVGRIARISATDPTFVANPGVTVWRCLAPQTLDPGFLYYFMQTPEFMDQVWAQAGNTDTFPYISLTQQRDLLISFPEIKVQRDIAQILCLLDEKHDLNRRMNETLEAAATAIFKDWFIDCGPTRTKIAGGVPYLPQDLWALFPDLVDGDEWPVGWRIESLYDQAEWVNGSAFSNSHFSDAQDALPIVKITELKAGITAQTKRTSHVLAERYRIKDGEILFSWSGNPDTSIDAFIWMRGDAWLNQHIFAVRPNGKHSRAFLYAMLKRFKPEFAEIARNKQTTGLGHVTKGDLQRMLIGTATPAICDAFDCVASPFLNRICANMRESQTLVRTRDFLLGRLVSGELRIKDAEGIAGAAA